VLLLRGLSKLIGREGDRGESGGGGGGRRIKGKRREGVEVGRVGVVVGGSGGRRVKRRWGSVVHELRNGKLFFLFRLAACLFSRLLASVAVAVVLRPTPVFIPFVVA